MSDSIHLHYHSPCVKLVPGSMVGERGEYNEAQKIDEESKPSGGLGRKKRLNGAENFPEKILKQKATADSTMATGSNFVKIMGKSFYT